MATDSEPTWPSSTASAMALGDDTPPMLRHYIEKRSYAKAIDFLEGRDEASATPNC